jgi:hypothetical protein
MTNLSIVRENEKHLHSRGLNPADVLASVRHLKDAINASQVAPELQTDLRKAINALNALLTT